MSEKYYITTAINYTNGLPHLGHAYEALVADIFARFYRSDNYDVCFCTGTDEHGQKIADTAQGQGKTPIELCDYFVGFFQALNGKLNISNDLFVRTTDPQHEAFCKWLWETVNEKGDIYLGNYEGWYNIKEESYVTETEAAARDYKDDAGNPLTKTKEPSYFFRMGNYQEQLVNHIKENPQFILPEAKKNEILHRLEEPLLELSISRTTFDWGVDVPNDEEHVMYVWFDALSNYLSAINYNDDTADSKNYWPANVHIIGKDIAWFHTVIWPCMLLSAGIPLPKTIFCHGFINDPEGKKMSKSIGNVVDPNEMLKKYKPDVLRFYLAKMGILGQDINFSEEALITLHDAELANGYGNLVSRAVNLPTKWYDSQVPDFEPIEFYDLETLHSEVKAYFDAFEIQNALERVLVFLRESNNWLATNAPWKLKGDETLEERGRIVRTIIEAVYIISNYLRPFLPDATRITIEESFHGQFMSLGSLSWNNLEPGTPITRTPVLFDRLEDNRFDKKKKQAKKQPKKAAGASFSDLEIRVGKILSAEVHPSADSLYVEQIDLGEDEPRTVVSGLRDHYNLDDLIGRNVVVIMNLPPKKTRGVVSHGMVYCVSNEEHTQVLLLEPPADSTPGDKIFIENDEEEPMPKVNAKRYGKLSPKFTTNDSGFPTYDNQPWQTTKGPFPASTLPNAKIA